MPETIELAVKSPAVSVSDFRAGMALLPGGVSVITTAGPAGQAGFTASAVCSVTDSPPTVLVCMNRTSHAHEAFVTNGVLCVNVLQGTQQALSALFADRTVRMEERFKRCGWRTLITGAPALNDALVSLDGTIVSTLSVGTHSVFFVALQNIRTLAEPDIAPGLVYFNRSYHTLPGPQALQSTPKGEA